MSFSRAFSKTTAVPARIDTVPSLPRDTNTVFEYGIVTSIMLRRLQNNLRGHAARQQGRRRIQSRGFDLRHSSNWRWCGGDRNRVSIVSDEVVMSFRHWRILVARNV